MRIAEPQTRSGYFWLPAEPDNRLPGTLKISDGGRVDLEVLGIFGGPSAFFQRNAVPRIHGVLDEGGYVTLDACIGGPQSLAFVGVSKSTFLAQLAFVGVLYSDAPVLLDNFSFSVEGLDDWLQQSGIKTIGWTSAGGTITFDPPADVAFDVGNGRRLGFTHSWRMSPGKTEASISQKAQIRIETDAKRPFEEFPRIANRITNFLCFAIDKTVSIDQASTFIAPAENSEEGEGPARIAIYYQSLPFAERPPRTDPHGMLFTYPSLNGSVADKFAKWFAAYEMFQPALSLYFASRAGAHRYLNGRFLSVVQALETYHRRTRNERPFDAATYTAFVSAVEKACPPEQRELLARLLKYGNELTLAARLKQIIDPFRQRLGDDEKRKRLVRQIVETRNYLTHYDSSLAERAADGADLLGLCMIGEAILQLHFLKETGFTDEEIADIVTRSDTLRAKLKGEPV